MDWTGGETPWSAARTAAITARSMYRTPREPAMPACLSPKSGGGGWGRAMLLRDLNPLQWAWFPWGFEYFLNI